MNKNKLYFEKKSIYIILYLKNNCKFFSTKLEKK